MQAEITVALVIRGVRLWAPEVQTVQVRHLVGCKAPKIAPEPAFTWH